MVGIRLIFGLISFRGVVLKKQVWERRSHTK